MVKRNVKPTECNDYFRRYLDLVYNETELVQGFKDDKNTVISFFSSFPKDKLDYRYQPEKWSVKEILQHIIDTERIFMYRFLRITRNDSTPLASFNQDIYIKPSEASA